MSERVARSRELVARGFRVATVARVVQISRQALYRVPTPRTVPQRRPVCWFGKLKEREVWLNEYETLDDARAGIDGYVDRYHHRPHSGLDYRTPDEVRRTWEDGRLQKTAA